MFRTTKQSSDQPAGGMTFHGQAAQEGDDKTKTLTTDEFISRASNLTSYDELKALRDQSLSTENLYRSLFARKRECWEIPEIDDPYLFLVDVFKNQSLFRRLPSFAEDGDTTPRCFELAEEIRKREGDLVVLPSQSEFDISWDCFTEGLLRFLDWKNVFCAGGAVSGCLSPLPDDIANVTSQAASRVKRRKYFHDTYLPGSDIDLFLYGLNEEEAEGKLLEIYDAIQAANPYEIRAFRSTHAITLVSQYPFRHVQIILRLYNSPSEILMGFDVDACTVGYDGNKVVVCPRTALAFATQSNTIDMTRRSPSYEMRLAKYASRGFEVLVPNLDRNRVDPCIYEKRFDQVKGLARLLMMERLRTPIDRLRYRITGNLKTKFSNGSLSWKIQRQIRKITGDNFNIERAEGLDSLIPSVSSPETSDYSAVFLPWGPNWTVERIEKQVKKKDRLLNKMEFFSDGRAIKNRRSYKIHLCAVGTMAEVIEDPFPNDPPIPEETPMEELEPTIRGRVTWLVDNPGRQRIGSFHPITEEDWTEGAFISSATEDLIIAVNSNDVDSISKLFDECESSEEAYSLLTSRDFLGRSSLHVATLANSSDAVQILLSHDAVTADFLNCRLSDGRSALHLAAMKGDLKIAKLLLEKIQAINTAAEIALEEEIEIEGKSEKDVTENKIILDIDASDWEVKMNPLHYAIILGRVDMVKLLLSYGASARKVAVHKDRNESFSVLTLLAMYAGECGERGEHVIRPMAELLIGTGGASTVQVDTNGDTIWHHLACSTNSHRALEILLEIDAAKNNGTVRALNVLDSNMRTPLFAATACHNSKAVDILLKVGAAPRFEEQEWDARLQTLVSSGRIGKYCYSSGSLGFNLNGENKRCPIFLAAQNADGPCLQVYLAFDSSKLANCNIRLPDNTVTHRKKFRVVRPFDILEMKRAGLLARDNGKSISKQHMQSRIDAIDLRYLKLKAKLEAYDEISYENYVLWLLVNREKDELETAEFRLKECSLSEDQKRDSKEALARIDEAGRILQLFGGVVEPRNEEKQDAMKSFISHSNYPPQGDSFFTALFQSYSEMQQPTQIYLYSVMSNQHIMKTLLSECHQKTAFDLMVAISKRDLIAIQKASQVSKIGIIDSVGVTPVFFAVMKSCNIDCIEEIYETAGRQFQAYQDWQESIDKRKKEKETDDVAEKNKTSLLKDQLRRLNNLDIAADETPVKAKPTPGMMRRVLEAAEDSADRQEQESKALNKTSSNLPPEWLLVYRSIVIPDKIKEPKLVKLKARLREKQPDSFSEDWEKHPVLLRPIELAVIRGDAQMVELLIQLAITTGYNDSQSKEEVEDTVNSLGKDEEDDEDDENYDSDTDYSDEELDDGSNRTKLGGRISISQLRYILTGDYSRNSSLGGMTLPQIAIAVNNLSIFRLIAKFAQYHLLPRGAVASWKREVDAIDAIKLDKKTRQKRDAETKKFLTRTNNNMIPYWRQADGFYSNEIMMDTTCLQFSLSIEAEHVAKALMSSELDAELLDWIFKSEGKTGNFVIAGEIRVGSNQERDSIVAAATWVSRQSIKEEATLSTLAFRLIRPHARDSIGRTALFYAPTSMLSNVLKSAVDSSLTAVPGESVCTLKTSFLEVETLTGSVTALKAAISARDVDRVKALIELGCSKSAPSGSMKWGPLHLAIPNRSKSKEEEKNARKIIELILECASDSELMECLLSPKAEHTPLMLAVNRGVESETIQLLVEKLAFRKKEGMTARDSELNTTLHLAVSNALSQQTKKSLDNVATLLELSEFPDDLGPNQENADGITPLEIALHAVLSIWDRASSHRIQQLHEHNSSNNNEKSPSRYEIEREVFALLEISATTGIASRKRIPVAFNEVKEVKEVKMRLTQKSEAGIQDEPRGPPGIFPSGDYVYGHQKRVCQYWPR